MPMRIVAIFIIFIFLIIVSLFTALLMALESKSYAHQAIPTAAQPLGWAYPITCCSGNDCNVAQLFKVYETPQGYSFTIHPGQHQMVTVVDYSDVIPYNDTRIKPSPDGLFHACISARTGDGKGDFEQRTICLFVPPRGF